ncbi:hypothetical protein OCGS_2015 [Oceaniovalibus guishaninsula JLT2003]|uniref:Lipoprotein n=1 Tax=Oceaniovalibus guishaninsula JLT2003 TaxID=1231392 RepID=K2HME2_9RHOB|nr:hypothetical protein [Oceaniovalibus guishaninsula]EKE44034.1 hypothetical protein OCGS_2015 [Oceaniovalibus guishaninsula JLT2003]
MGRTWIAALACAALLAGCGQSRLNPFNWFGGSTETVTLDTGRVVAVETRPLVEQVAALDIARKPGGAILTATGLPPVQGFWNGALVPVGDAADGRLDFEFRIEPPLQPTRVSTAVSREVIVGIFLTDRQLAGVSEIRVSGARNARAVRR